MLKEAEKEKKSQTRELTKHHMAHNAQTLI